MMNFKIYIAYLIIWPFLISCQKIGRYHTKNNSIRTNLNNIISKSRSTYEEVNQIPDMNEYIENIYIINDDKGYLLTFEKNEIDLSFPSQWKAIMSYNIPLNCLMDGGDCWVLMIEIRRKCCHFFSMKKT